MLCGHSVTHNSPRTTATILVCSECIKKRGSETEERGKKKKKKREKWRANQAGLQTTIYSMP